MATIIVYGEDKNFESRVRFRKEVSMADAMKVVAMAITLPTTAENKKAREKKARRMQPRRLPR